MWCFVYGSLMWKLPQGAGYERKVRAVLKGYRRSFCVKSYTYRGTQSRPGLCLGLEEAPKEQCEGFALDLGEATDSEAQARYLAIDGQEMVYDSEPPLYLRLTLPTTLVTGETVYARTFVANPGCLSGILHSSVTAAARAEQILTSPGGSRGSNMEYVENTATQLESVGIVDSTVEEIRSLVRRHRSENGIAKYAPVSHRGLGTIELKGDRAKL